MKSNFSRIIQGCMSWGKWGNNLSSNEMEELIQFNLENGISSFDHADIYGDYTTETEFGKAFKNSSVKREDIQLISKCGIQYVGKTRPKNTVKHYQYDSNYIVYSAEKSIKDLNSEYLDLLLLHRPSPLIHPDEIKKAVDVLISQGKIRMFGVSNFSNEQTDLISLKSKVSVNQIQFSLSYNKALFDSSLDYMIANNIIPMSWSPLGLFFKEKNKLIDDVHLLLDEFCEKYTATKDQLLLSWILKHPSNIHPVIGTVKKERILKAIESEYIKLSEIDWFRMLETYLGHKLP
ncbi:MAG: aldo/keto reductase [Flavobacteriaceae bacterium]|nr:aldo/keto reductase [Flavobacteriaceae bacterium]